MIRRESGAHAIRRLGEDYKEEEGEGEDENSFRAKGEGGE